MKLLKGNNPILGQKSTNIDWNGDDFRALCKILSHYYYVEKSEHILGCSLPQFGILKRICLCKLPVSGVTIMINPKIKFKFGFKKSQEGCESLGGKEHQYIVRRPILGLVEWRDESMQKHTKWFTYKSMRIIQHELDHFEGLLIDRGIKLW